MPAGPIFNLTIPLGIPAAVTGPVYSFSLPLSIPGAVTGPVYEHDVDYTEETRLDVWVQPTDRGFPSSTAVSYYRIAKREGVDLTVEATAPLYIVPTGKKAVIRYVVVRCTEATSITSVALASVGANADLTAIYADQQLLGLTTSALRFVFPNGPGSQDILNAGETLNFTVNTAAVGTSQTVSVDVFGDEF